MRSYFSLNIYRSQLQCSDVPFISIINPHVTIHKVTSTRGTHSRSKHGHAKKIAGYYVLHPMVYNDATFKAAP